MGGTEIMNLFLSEVGSIPLLSAREEGELAASWRRGEEAERELRSGGEWAAEVREQLLTAATEGRRARGELIKANCRLVMSLARRSVGQGVPLLDLIQEGTIGLINAIDRFDHRLGYKLSTYATWWVRQALTRAVASQGRNIRLPVHRYQQHYELIRASSRLAQELGRETTSQELAEYMGIALQEVEGLLKSAERTVSLETPVGEEGDSLLVDFIEDEDARSPEDVLAASMKQERIEEVLSLLAPREEEVIRLRFGFQNGRSYTLREIGQRMGLTKEGIRQIELEALVRLRDPALAPKLRDL